MLARRVYRLWQQFDGERRRRRRFYFFFFSSLRRPNLTGHRLYHCESAESLENRFVSSRFFFHRHVLKPKPFRLPRVPRARGCRPNGSRARASFIAVVSRLCGYLRKQTNRNDFLRPRRDDALVSRTAAIRRDARAPPPTIDF